jgi:hypothetical protein
MNLIARTKMFDATRPASTKSWRAIPVALILAAGGLGGCNSAGEGAVSGAGIGALAGMGLGSLGGHMGRGAAAGAIIGAVGGLIIGDQNSRR